MWEIRRTLHDLRRPDMGKCKHAAAKTRSVRVNHQKTIPLLRWKCDIIYPNHSLMGLSPLILDTSTDYKSRRPGEAIYAGHKSPESLGADDTWQPCNTPGEGGAPGGVWGGKNTLPLPPQKEKNWLHVFGWQAGAPLENVTGVTGVLLSPLSGSAVPRLPRSTSGKTFAGWKNGKKHSGPFADRRSSRRWGSGEMTATAVRTLPTRPMDSSWGDNLIKINQ